MFDFGTIMNAMGAGKTVISPEANIVANPYMQQGIDGNVGQQGGFMTKMMDIFRSKDGQSAGNNGQENMTKGLSEVLSFFGKKVSANGEEQPQQEQGPVSPPPVFNTTSGITTKDANPTQGQSSRRLSQKVNLGDILRGGNDNGF